jgi:hypothetical protein
MERISLVKRFCTPREALSALRFPTAAERLRKPPPTLND